MVIPREYNIPRIFSVKNNRNYLYTGLIISILTWILFKCYYPYPYFTYDSYLYFADAVANVNVSYRPIGYSKFIRWMSYISHSQYFIVTIQYVFFRGAIIYLFLTLRIFLKLDRITSFVLFCFLFFNPLFLDACNHILSDSLFTSISIIWFTQLIWLIKGTSKWLIFSQGILLLLAFVLRYNALYYPVISTIVLFLCPFERKLKIAGIVFQFLLVGSFYFYTSFLINKSTGYFQFSPLSSWKIANNALYMVDNMNSRKPGDVPKEFIAIDTFVQQYLNAPHYVNKLQEQDITNGSFFIFMEKSPLNRYLASKYGSVTTQIDFFKVAPYFKKYGYYLIRNNLLSFFKFVIWPNFQQYLMPNTEVFNSGDIKLYYVQKKEERKVVSPFINLVEFKPLVRFGIIRSEIFALFPMLFFILHLNFIISMIATAVMYVLNENLEMDIRVSLLAVLIWILNIFFSTISAPSVLRFELFISIVEFSFAIYFFRVASKSYLAANQ